MGDRVLMFEPGSGRRVQIMAPDVATFEARGYSRASRASSTGPIPAPADPPQAAEEIVDLEEMTVAELRELAAEEGVDISGLKKKAELVDALARADMTEREHPGTGVAMEGIEAELGETVTLNDEG